MLAKRGDHYFMSARNDRAAMMNGFRGLTEGCKELKLHGGAAAAFVADAIEAPSKSYRRKHILAGGILLLARQWLSLIFFLLVGFIGLLWPTLRPSDAGIIVGYALTLLYVQSTVESMMRSSTYTKWRSRSTRRSDVEVMRSTGWSLVLVLSKCSCAD